MDPQFILLVDDEVNILNSLSREIRAWAADRSLEICTAHSGAEALAFMEASGEKVAIVVSDLRMPGMRGSDFLLAAKAKFPRFVAILLTGYSETEEVIKAVSAGIFSYILKPWDSEYLLSEITKAWNWFEAVRQNEEHSKLLEEELKLAGELQRNLLKPILKRSDGMEFRSSYRPVPGLWCGGDFYDVIALPSGRYLVVVADVAGHGVKAALVTIMLRAFVQYEYIDERNSPGFTPAEFLSWLGHRVFDGLKGVEGMLVTCLAAVIDPGRGIAVFANAGHNHPWLIGNGSGISEIPVSGVCLGVERQLLFREERVSLAEGDTLLLFTDGLVEHGKGLDSADFGGVLASVPAGADWHKRLMESCLKATGSEAFSDDVTILSAKVAHGA